MATECETDNPAARLAAFAAGLGAGDAPGPVRERARYLLLDAIGVAVASSRQDFAEVMLAGFRAVGETGEAGVIAMGARLALRDAAALNAALVHGLDFDDTHPGAVVHGTAVSLPAALAIGEARDLPGHEILTAYIAAMEAAARIGLAADYGFHRHGYHATGVAGHFSSALAAGRLMGLDAEGLHAAQGVCVSTATASREFWSDGAWNKRFHPGWAAAAGITAAGLAGAGFKGCERPYDGRYGLFRMHLGADAEAVDFTRLADGLGERWELLESAVKPFPTCHYTHAIIDSAIRLRDEHELRPEQIASVTVRVHEDLIPPLMEPEALKRRPPDGYAARFSAPWAAACGLALGRLGLAELEPEALRDPAVLALAARTHCRPDPDSLFPRYFSAGVEVETLDGRRVCAHEPVNRGAGERALSNAEIAAKFDDNAGPVLGAAAARSLAAHLLDIERLTGKALMLGLVEPSQR